jgi:RNA polymerase sigma-70 factor (ECF subfamily)
VVAARAGEEWATEALFRRHAKGINGLAFRLLGRDNEVDDLVQDSFIEAFTCLTRLRTPEAFASWLRSIVVHRATKLIRRRRLLSRLGLGRGWDPIELDSIIATATPADVATELRRVYGLIESLPADLRVPLVLRRIEGLTLEEIAELVGASLATVKRRLARAEKELGAREDPS